MNASLEIQLQGFISRHPALKNVIQTASKIAPSDIPVLIEGEVGTGKEWLARAIHFASSRANGEFVVVDCSNFAGILLESELFGYMRGSFAGAIHEKKGLIELAAGGTIFVDHLSHLTVPLQGKLLRVIMDSTFHKIGGVSEIRADVRWIASTDQDLRTLVMKGKFREDLYYHLGAMRLTLPPLRERRDDILGLADWFLSQIAQRDGTEKKVLTQEAESVLRSYGWPGNIRELEREIERAVVLAGPAKKIGKHQLNPALNRRTRMIDAKAALSGSLRDRKRKMVSLLEANAIREALLKTGGNRSHAAQLLAISRQELIRKISSYKIKR